MSAHVLLNLLNELRKSDKNARLASGSGSGLYTAVVDTRLSENKRG